MKSTHTSAILEVSKATYEEIAAKLKAAGYDHAFLQGRYGPEHVDMNGIMLRREQPAFDHSKRTTKYFEKTLGFCICKDCEKLPDNGPRVEDP